MKDLLKIQTKKLSFIYEKKAILIILTLIVIALLTLILSLSIGNTNYSLFTVSKTLLGFGSKGEELIINKFRLPRALIALLIGSSLALSGMIIQTVVKNPLASPDLVGVGSGGILGALLFLTVFTDPYANTLIVSIMFMPIFSFLGGLIAALLIYFLAFKNGVTPYRLILIGIAISGAFVAISNILIINGPMIVAFEANTFLSGSINGKGMEEVKLLSIWLISFTVLTIFMVRELNVQNLDDPIAISVGSKLEKKRLLLLLIGTALASAAVAIGGAIGFVGLVAPHISRRLVNSSIGNLVPVSLLIGGILVLLADVVGRTIFYPIEVPAGVFTSAIGAPYFIYLLWKYN